MLDPRIQYPRVRDYDKTEILGYFDAGLNYYEQLLLSLGTSIESFEEILYMDYLDARPIYKTAEDIQMCFYKTYLKNQKKYEIWQQVYAAEYDPIQNYDRHEESTKTRTPDLTQETEAQSQRNQTRTTTDNPQNYTETETRSVSPYDSQTMAAAEQYERSASGARNTTETYSGAPDTASSTTTTTGTDTDAVESHIYGNIGVTTSQMMLASSLDLADRMRLVQEIEQDIAKELFLQVWL